MSIIGASYINASVSKASCFTICDYEVVYVGLEKPGTCEQDGLHSNSAPVVTLQTKFY